MKLRVVIEKDETGYYVAEVPALPGCMSQGKTLQEARANILEAIAGWVAVMNKKAMQHHAHSTHEVAV
jgi:predicted RNase H-like HicB family nuclease